jgi:hypothetical protein
VTLCDCGSSRPGSCWSRGVLLLKHSLHRRDLRPHRPVSPDRLGARAAMGCRGHRAGCVLPGHGGAGSNQRQASTCWRSAWSAPIYLNGFL